MKIRYKSAVILQALFVILLAIFSQISMKPLNLDTINTSKITAASNITEYSVRSNSANYTDPGSVTTESIKPVFNSSFVQYWYCQNWSQKEWMQEFTMLQKVGINEVIIQDVADNKEKYAVYPTELPGYKHNEVDMLGTALTAADALGMKVRVGLGFNKDWWNKNASDKDWLNREADKNKSIFEEIVEMYGKHPSLTGWYIPYEFSQLTAPNRISQRNLNSFYKQIVDNIKLKSNQSIMVAPFYNSQLPKQIVNFNWSKMLKNILTGTGIDIVALQDSVGVGYNTINQLDRIYASTKEGIDGMILYAVTETFSISSTGNIPAPQNRIKAQLAAELPHVKGFVAFSFGRYQNENDIYNDYYNYFLLMNNQYYL